MDKIVFLGYVVSVKGIKMDEVRLRLYKNDLHLNQLHKLEVFIV